MAYIGKQPVVGNFVKLDAITTSATATYNLLNGGVAYFPQTANNCIVSLNGVIQSPTSAYTISGSTIVFSDALTASDSIDFILVLGDVLAIGTPSDGTITSAKLASGTDGLFAWQSVQTTGFTAVAARAYPCNTTSASFTVTLPATPSAGDQVQVVDYAGTFDTNILIIDGNGEDIEGGTDDLALTGEREGVILTYIDSTQGWIATSGINEGTDALKIIYPVDFLVIAGGGGGGLTDNGGYAAGGGGAGGYRNSYLTETSGGGASSESSLTFNVGTVYTVTVGGGGASGTTPAANGTSGSNSVISGTGITTITSTGGGGGGFGNTASAGTGSTGGSGGGGGNRAGTPGTGGSGGSGTANQGFGGGKARDHSNNDSFLQAGGGGGASAVGESPASTTGGAGGNGLASSITGSSVTRAGGGGGATYNQTVGPGGTGGGGNGAKGTPAIAGTSGTVNTGSGGGGSNGITGGSGGSGVVILRMPTARYSGTTTGSPTVTTSGSDTIVVFNSSGTITG
jgi:hypothetical protein